MRERRSAESREAPAPKSRNTSQVVRLVRRRDSHKAREPTEETKRQATSHASALERRGDTQREKRARQSATKARGRTEAKGGSWEKTQETETRDRKKERQREHRRQRREQQSRPVERT